MVFSATTVTGTAVLEYGPTEILPPVGANGKPCASLPTQSPSQPRTPARKAGVLYLRKRIRERDRLSAGGNRIRTIGPASGKVVDANSSDQTRVGRTSTLGGGAESSLEGRDIELSVSPKDIRTSPYDLCATARIDDNLGRGTDGSNPLPSSGESATNRELQGMKSPLEGPMVRIRFPPAASQQRTVLALASMEPLPGRLRRVAQGDLRHLHQRQRQRAFFGDTADYRDQSV